MTEEVKKATPATPDPFADMQEIKTQSLTFDKIGDWARGTLTRKDKAPSKFHEGSEQNVYEFKAQGGSVHDKEGKGAELVDGAYYSFWGKPQLDNGMRNVRIGQVFGVRFKETKPSTKGNPQKIFTIALGGMDESYGGETAMTVEQAVEESGI